MRPSPHLALGDQVSLAAFPIRFGFVRELLRVSNMRGLGYGRQPPSPKNSYLGGMRSEVRAYIDRPCNVDQRAFT